MFLFGLDNESRERDPRVFMREVLNQSNPYEPTTNRRESVHTTASLAQSIRSTSDPIQPRNQTKQEREGRKMTKVTKAPPNDPTHSARPDLNESGLVSALGKPEGKCSLTQAMLLALFELLMLLLVVAVVAS